MATTYARNERAGLEFPANVLRLLPYDYYVLLRLFLCGLSLYFLTRPGVRESEKWVLAGLALLYNPIVPIGLGSKVVWSIINIATVAWFWTLNRRV